MAGSNGTRMAGEELSRAERNRQTREEIGNDPDRLAERIAGVDREAYDFDGYTDKQINMAMQGSSFDENDYARLTGKPIDDGGDDGGGGGDDGGGGGDDGGEVGTDPVTPAPTPTPSPDPGGDQVITLPSPITRGPYGSMTQNINQDNDINSTVTGNNNTVTNSQDNSIKQYGGGGSWTNAWMKDYFS